MIRTLLAVTLISTFACKPRTFNEGSQAKDLNEASEDSLRVLRFRLEGNIISREVCGSEAGSKCSYRATVKVDAFKKQFKKAIQSAQEQARARQKLLKAIPDALGFYQQVVEVLEKNNANFASFQTKVLNDLKDQNDQKQKVLDAVTRSPSLYAELEVTKDAFTLAGGKTTLKPSHTLKDIQNLLGFENRVKLRAKKSMPVVDLNDGDCIVAGQVKAGLCKFAEGSGTRSRFAITNAQLSAKENNQPVCVARVGQTQDPALIRSATVGAKTTSFDVVVTKVPEQARWILDLGGRPFKSSKDGAVHTLTLMCGIFNFETKTIVAFGEQAMNLQLARVVDTVSNLVGRDAVIEL